MKAKFLFTKVKCGVLAAVLTISMSPPCLAGIDSNNGYNGAPDGNNIGQNSPNDGYGAVDNRTQDGNGGSGGSGGVCCSQDMYTDAALGIVEIAIGGILGMIGPAKAVPSVLPVVSRAVLAKAKPAAKGVAEWLGGFLGYASLKPGKSSKNDIVKVGAKVLGERVQSYHIMTGNIGTNVKVIDKLKAGQGIVKKEKDLFYLEVD